MCLGSLTACDTDMEKIFLNTEDDITLGGASREIVLTADNPDALALTVYWDGDGRLSLSDSLVQAPVYAADIAVELARTQDFTDAMVINVDRAAHSRQFLAGELNNILGRMGYEGTELMPLFIRVRSLLAANQPARYSNVLCVKVKNFVVHLNIATVLEKDKSESAKTLGSATENGIYTGFMGVGGWYNWWLKEANGVTWGNLGESGKTFHASSAADSWNFWFPEPAGCYFATVNTVEGWWSALYIPELKVSGDVQGVMTYNRALNQWTLPIDVKKAGDIKISISGTGKLYNKVTGDTGQPIEQNVGFGGTAQALTFGDNASPITLSVAAGASALVLDLSNPLQWTIGTGAVQEEPTVAQQIFLSGVLNWDFADYLSLYDEAELKYAAAHYVKSEWGYRLYPTAEWSPAYRAGDGSTAMAGTLVLASNDKDGNIPAPANGLYVMDFDMKALSYALTEVKSLSMAGANDDWSLKAMTQDASNPEIWTVEFSKTANTPWGVKLLVNGDWGLFFGGAKGKLKLGKSDATTGFDGDNDVPVGKTAVLTVDLGKQTYSYSVK